MIQFRPVWRILAVACAIIAPAYAVVTSDYASCLVCAACGIVFLVLHHHSRDDFL